MKRQAVTGAPAPGGADSPGDDLPHRLVMATPSAPQGASPAGDATGHKNMMQLIQLRWLAVLGQVATIALVHLALQIRLPLVPMAAVLGSLVVLNLLSYWRFRAADEAGNGQLLLSLLLDVAGLTALLYLSGGATNPFVFLYLLQVTLAAVLLEAWSTWTVVAVTTGCFAVLTRFYVPLELGPGGIDRLFDLHIVGMFFCFLLDAALLVVFMSRIMRNLRHRDARLADLRQRAAEEDHIVRMGLLASGAAHELGTPLATVSVILGDWRRMRQFQSDPDLLQDVQDMQAEVQRCKSIVTGILLAAGEARGESPAVTTVGTFLDELVDDWRATRPVKSIEYENRFGDDMPIISDSALKQIICNVLDNALEASPRWLRFTASRVDDSLVLSVRDRGPGFGPEMLARFGKPYQSSKGRAGSGLGLFLVVNVVRKFGGSVSAGNDPDGGAVVTLNLPLAALSIREADSLADDDTH